MKRSRVTIGASFQIDQSAQRIFESWLPNNWLIRKDIPDVYLDYLVEPVEGGELTGLRFGVQLKGRARFEQEVGEAVGHSFKQKHLLYYLKCGFPVFLVLVDVTSSEGRWVFAQQHLCESVDQAKLKGHRTVKLRFPPEQNLRDFAPFYNLLPGAFQFIRNKFPGTVTAALSNRKSELEAMDPRVQVSISVQEGRELLRLTPKEKLPLKIILRASNPSELGEQIRSLVDHGKRLTLSPGDVELSGSPLVEHLWENQGQGTIDLQLGHKFPGTVLLTFEGITPTFLQFDGIIQVGRRFINFEGGWRGSPIAVEVCLPLAGQPSRLGLNINFQWNAWAGQLASRLRFFNKTNELMNVCSSGVRMEMELLTEGNRLCVAKNPSLDLHFDDGLVTVFRWICKLRGLSAHYSVHIPLPDLTAISDDDWALVDTLGDLIQGKEIRERCPDGVIVASPKNPDSCAALVGFKGELVIITERLPTTLFGITIHVEGIKRCYTGVESTVALLPTGGRSLHFRAMKDCERIISLVKL